MGHYQIQQDLRMFNQEGRMPTQIGGYGSRRD
jgi:hypothetical protein